jgi:hypothetical protein
MTGFASKRARSSDLEKQIAQSLADKISKEIDKEVLDTFMTDILVEEGWTKTDLNPAFPKYGMMSAPFEDWYSRTAEWIHLNAQGDYKLVRGQWLFKDPRDATMFILRWS